MTPRRDPDTRPVALTVQYLRRGRPNKFGADLDRRDGRKPRPARPVQTANGLPQLRYTYRGAEPLELELPHLCESGCGRRRARPGQCAVCAGYYDTPGDPE